MGHQFEFNVPKLWAHLIRHSRGWLIYGKIIHFLKTIERYTLWRTESVWLIIQFINNQFYKKRLLHYYNVLLSRWDCMLMLYKKMNHYDLAKLVALNCWMCICAQISLSFSFIKFVTSMERVVYVPMHVCALFPRSADSRRDFSYTFTVGINNRSTFSITLHWLTPFSAQTISLRALHCWVANDE